MQKKCFKCQTIKDLDCFYVHPGMKDGHLNKCKDCTKNDSSLTYVLKKQDNKFVENERFRGRDKYRRLYTGTGKANPESNKRYAEKYPEKIKCNNLSSKLKKPFEGAEKHHWSYNLDHAKDVIWLTKKEHGKAHRFIIYDQERKMYRNCFNNVLLDTKECHELFIRDCISNQPD